MLIPFTKGEPFKADVNCSHCGSVIMKDINDESPHGMSALNDGFDYQCDSCYKLVRG